MAITIEITTQNNKKIAIPYKKTQIIEDLIKEIVKRASILDVPLNDIQLYNENSELFNEDTLEDLGIVDGATLTFKIKNSAVPSLDAPTPSSSTITPTSTTNDLDSKVNSLTIQSESESETSSTFNQEIRQIDIIVLDLSGSMKVPAYRGSAVPGELEMTRIEVAQALFQTFIDKYVQQEVPACVGLVCFGERIDLRFGLTRNFDSFSTELGDVEANQSMTRLYQAIKLAGETIVQYLHNHPSDIVLAPRERLNCRVFALTDGEDNSKFDPYEVYKYLKQHNIVLDAIPVGSGADVTSLGRFTQATGGSCFVINSSQAGVELFEREALINLSARDNFAPFSLAINSDADFKRTNATTVTTVERKVDTTVSSSGKCVSTMSDSTAAQITGGGSRVNKRIMTEYKAFQKEIDSAQTPNFYIFMSETNLQVWKVILRGPSGTSYDGKYLISVVFPDDYPFRPPKVRFETKVYHCNISTDGNICLDILKDSYSPAITVHKIMLSICALLTNPNADDPLDSVKAGVYRDNPTQYFENARLWNKQYADFTLAEMKQLHSLE